MRASLRSLPVLLAFGLASCDAARDPGSPAAAAAGAGLMVGEMDPKAPPDWPLAIGDRDIGGVGVGSAEDSFEYWMGNCCISFVDGVPYTAKWRREAGAQGSRRVYEGHVRAEADWDYIWLRAPLWRFTDEELAFIERFPDRKERLRVRIEDAWKRPPPGTIFVPHGVPGGLCDLDEEDDTYPDCPEGTTEPRAVR